MDKRVIEKVIESHGGGFSEFKYENPLMDKSLAKSLSRSFVKLLKDPNLSDLNRSLVLVNLRKVCKVSPPEHLIIDDNLTKLVKNTYEEHLNEYNINKELDSFLLRYLKEMNINSVHPTSVKPDIVQALSNLNGKQQEKYDTILKDVIYWNVDSNQNIYMDILKPMWNMDYISRTQIETDDISIKMKPLIEKLLLTCAIEMLSIIIIDENEWFCEKTNLMQLIEICSVSNECFQISCSIMNSLFINTNFDKQVLKFIELFIDSIKRKKLHIYQLYPPNLRHIVLSLDIELDNLDGQKTETYIETALKQLQELHKVCANDLIMLLSHFNKWFDLYYNYHSKLNS